MKKKNKKQKQNKNKNNHATMDKVPMSKCQLLNNFFNILSYIYNKFVMAKLVKRPFISITEKNLQNLVLK